MINIADPKGLKKGGACIFVHNSLSFVGIIISFIFHPWICTGLQNPYGSGNSHIFRNQKVKPTQKGTTITCSNTVFDVSAQYKLFSMMKHSKIVACTSTI